MTFFNPPLPSILSLPSPSHAITPLPPSPRAPAAKSVSRGRCEHTPTPAHQASTAAGPFIKRLSRHLLAKPPPSLILPHPPHAFCLCLSNSIPHRTQASTAAGPFIKRDTSLGIFSHNVVPIRAPKTFGTGAQYNEFDIIFAPFPPARFRQHRCEL